MTQSRQMRPASRERDVATKMAQEAGAAAAAAEDNAHTLLRRLQEAIMDQENQSHAARC